MRTVPPKNSCTSISLAHTSNRLLGTYDHLINKDTKRPPVHRCRVALRCDDFRCNVLCNQSDNRPSNRNLGEGARPSVPTNEFVRKLAVHVIVSTNGTCKILRKQETISHSKLTPLCSECTIVGIPLGSFDCFARSKSDNMMCPDWWSRMSTKVHCQIEHALQNALSRTFRFQIAINKSH